MSNLLNDFVNNLTEVLNLLSIYMVIGIIISGLLSALISKEWISYHLKNDKFLSIFKAVMFGIPLPLCSCGVLPMAMTLKKMGASRASVVSFLVATPMTGVDAILVNSIVFGTLFTIYTVGIAFFSALIVGLLVMFLLKENKRFSLTPPNSQTPSRNEISFLASKSFGELYRNFLGACHRNIRDLTKPMVGGVILAAIIMVIVPDNNSVAHSEFLLMDYLIVLAIGIPIYVCSVSVIPVAVSLYAIGFSSGAVMAFVLIAPVISVINISVLLSFLKRAEVAILITVVSVITITVGLIIDTQYPMTLNINFDNQHETGWIRIVASIILSTLFMIYLFRWIKEKFFTAKNEPESCCSSSTPEPPKNDCCSSTPPQRRTPK